jgi:hypothetical protein
MNALRLFGQSRLCRGAFITALLLGGCILLSSTGARAHVDDATQTGETIKCITPDGRVTAISNSDAASDVTTAVPAISWQLEQGETIFIIPFAKGALCDRFTFINENAAAAGELEIAVSTSHLSAESQDWTAVEGIVPFSHKRRFNLSILGINARYVKLSFRVEKTASVTRADSDAQKVVATDKISSAKTAPAPAAPAQP